MSFSRHLILSLHYLEESGQDDVIKQINGQDRRYRNGGVKILISTSIGFYVSLHMITLSSVIKYEYRKNPDLDTVKSMVYGNTLLGRIDVPINITGSFKYKTVIFLKFLFRGRFSPWICLWTR